MTLDLGCRTLGAGPWVPDLGCRTLGAWHLWTLSWHLWTLSSLRGEKQVSKTSLSFFLAALTTLDSASLDVPVGLLLERVVKLGVESELGAALVELLGCEMLQKWADMIKTWNAVWQRLGANIPGLVVPLRLLDTASNYLVTERCECLLKLPLEERKLLMEVLRVPNDSF